METECQAETLPKVR